MDRAEQIRITKRLLAHIQAGTTDSQPEQTHMPATGELDEGLWHEEMDRIYKSVPLVAGSSAELPGPGTYKSCSLINVPIIITRAKDGELRAFLNSCSHRGTP